MNILILGGGGREHALAWKIGQSPLCTKLFIAPGNAGTLLCGHNVDIDINDFKAVGKFTAENKIDMIVVGPEAPLVKGVSDYFYNNPELSKIAVIGPCADGAKLEGSKDYAKAFMQKYQIPTAKYKSFTAKSLNEGLEFLDSLKPPYVLKADGLAAGKGVLILDDLDEAKSSLQKMVSERMFGDASDCVVIEEFLVGVELSVFAAVDGKNYVLLPEAKDYKRIGEGDTGPNTGGMGCVSPVKFADNKFMGKVKNQIIEPTINGLINENIKYKGFIFFGLMNVQGEPFVIEYNVRLGDPEAEVVLPRINSDVVQLLKDMDNGCLDNYKIDIIPESAVTIILASGGYPGSYDKGFEITGLDSVNEGIVFYAGASIKDGALKTSGGRVLAVTSLDDNLDGAMKKANIIAESIDFKGKYFRKDIGRDII